MKVVSDKAKFSSNLILKIELNLFFNSFSIGAVPKNAISILLKGDIFFLLILSPIVTSPLTIEGTNHKAFILHLSIVCQKLKKVLPVKLSSITIVPPIDIGIKHRLNKPPK